MNKKKKNDLKINKTICVLIYDYSIKGGAQRVATNVFNELDTGDRNIVFVSVFKKHEYNAFLPNKDIKVFYLNEGEGHLIKTFFRSYKKLSRIIKEMNVSLIVAAGYSVDLLASLGSFLFKIPMIHWEHTSLGNAIYNNDIVSRLYRVLGVHRASAIVALTQKNKLEFIKKYHINAEKVFAIPNWIENGAENYTYNSTSKTIVTIGRADRVKGYDRLLDVAEIVYKRHREWEWQIWGDFDTVYGAEIIRKVEEKGLGKFVVIKGTTNNINEVYDNSAICVLTSYYEGLPMVLLEAKKHKIPIVSFDIETGPSEIIKDCANGFLIPDNQIEEMANRICLLIENQQMRDEFSENALIDIDKFDKGNIIRLWNYLLDRYR